MSQSQRLSKKFGSVKVTNGQVKLGSTTSVAIESTPAPTALAVGATTITAAQVLAGVVTQAPSSALTVTLPTATAFLAALPDAVVGDSFKFSYINTSGANIGTIAADASGSLVGAGAVAVTSSAAFLFRVTAVSTPAYIVYRV